MLLRETSLSILGQDQFHSKTEAKEYVQLFLSDLCFWEQASDTNRTSQPASPASVEEEKRQGRLGRSKAMYLVDEESDESSQEQPIPSEDDLRWKAAVDPITGKVYYYDSLTRQTQWEKPLELRSWEKKVKKHRLQKERAFFRQMEENIKASLARGESIPGIPPGVSLQEAVAAVQPQLVETSSQRATSSGPERPRRSVRTISGMDEQVVVSLKHTISQTTMSQSTSSTKGSSTAPLVHFSSARPMYLSTIDAPLPPAMSTLDDPTSPTERSGCDAASSAMKSTLVASSARETTYKAKTQSHVRRNTGNTIFVKSTMANPDVKATIKCVCGVFRAHIVQGEQRKPPRSSPQPGKINFDVFRDDYQIPRRRRQLVLMPSLEEITTFYYEYFSRSQMEHDTIIMSLIYVERLIKETNGALAPARENWRSLLFSCMIMASKVWDDLSMWNIDFSNVSLATGITPYSLERINQLELSVLTSLNFDVRVPASEYAKYYFLIRNMLLRGGLLQAAPLSQEEAKRLEHRTSHYQSARVSNNNNNNTRNNRRSLSVDWDWLKQKAAQQEQGPVLKDNLCVEQIVSMEQTQ